MNRRDFLKFMGVVAAVATLPSYNAYQGNLLKNHLTGTLLAYSKWGIPRGWLPCDGRSVSINQYPELHDLLKTSYGIADRNTEFKLPDLRGRFTANQKRIDYHFNFKTIYIIKT